MPVAPDLLVQGTLLTVIPNDEPGGPPIEVRVLQTLLDLPSTYLAEAGIFSFIGNFGTPPVARLPERERHRLFSGLTSTLHRATYHKGRIDQYVTVAGARFTHHEGRAFGDSAAMCVLFEAPALLSAARSFVEEVIYVGARLAGGPPPDAHRRAEKELKGGGSLPERKILGRHLAWFEELTEYRNALVHRGMMGRFGYAPVGATVVTADDPTFNVMLVPDRASIQKPNRPDAWTFNDGTRLETLLGDTWSGLLTFAREIGALWGRTIPPGAVPPPGAEHGSTLLVLPRGAVAQRKR